jgi:uncharacterized damage-inducible protein DinB
MSEQILESWRVNHRINLMLLNDISAEGLKSTLSLRGGRDVARQFAHMHDMRVAHLQAYAKDLAAPLKAFAKKGAPKVSPTKSALVKALDESAEAIGQWLALGVANPDKWSPSQRGVINTLSYLIAHESHHRGSILLTLKQSGHKVSKEIVYGIWEWKRL